MPLPHHHHRSCKSIKSSGFKVGTACSVAGGNHRDTYTYRGECRLALIPNAKYYRMEFKGGFPNPLDGKRCAP